MPEPQTSELTPEYLNENRQADLYAATTITYLGALSIVCLRLWARKLNGARYRLDDWFIIAAQVSVGARVASHVLLD